MLHRAPIGIFRQVEAPAYDDLAREQVDLARGHGDAEQDLQAMINGGDTFRPLSPVRFREPVSTTS